MFSLIQRKVKLANVNPRAEIHGEEHVIACDLKVEVNVDNGCLAEFHPRLKSSIYWRDESVQGDIIDQANAANAEYKPNLIFPLMGAIKWDTKLVGATVTVHAPVSKNDIVLEACTVDNFVLEPQEGGTVEITCRVIAHPDEKTIGRLCGMIQNDIDVSIVPPAAA